MTADLLALRDWLCAVDVTFCGMGLTGVYWKCVFYVLEDDIECWLLNARHLRNVPGKKTGVKDAEWVCQLVGHGLVSPSFVPPKPVRELRDLTRYRKAQTEERGREAQRLDVHAELARGPLRPRSRCFGKRSMGASPPITRSSSPRSSRSSTS